MSIEIGSRVYVVTNVEAGWDCVRGVYSTYESLLEYFLEIYEDDEDDEDSDGITENTTLDELEDFLCHIDSRSIIHYEYLR